MKDEAQAALEEVIEFYLESGDFNGLSVPPYRPDQRRLDVLRGLLDQGLLEVVGDADFPNPHIRPWPNRRSSQEQGADLAAAATEDKGTVCLYPTPAALIDYVPRTLFNDQPYRRRLAEGRGQLELAYFSLDVLEPYRGDPRYRYEPGDFEATFGITDEAFADLREPERDKIGTVRAGFAYDVETLDSDAVERYLCSFLRDLADLTPEHQRRWESYEVEAGNLTPHPVWWAMMGGHWPDGIGVFDKIVGEMAAINDLARRMFAEPLFESTERPREWGWILRPSTAEWGQFVLTTDKLLSENMRHRLFDAAGVERTDDSGQPLGTLKRLERMLASKARLGDSDARDLVQPFREVRAQRQRPAHTLSEILRDRTSTARQRDLLSAVAESLEAMRRVLMEHPGITAWAPQRWLDEKWYRL